MVSKTIELKKVLKNILETVHDRVFQLEADDKADFPYIVYDFNIINSDENLSVYNLEINLWDKNSTTYELDMLGDSLENKLHKYKHIDDKMQFSIYNGGIRQYIKDENKELKRLRMVFQIRFYERRNYYE